MLQTLRRALLKSTGAEDVAGCTACPAEPGTVTPHHHHVLVRLAPPEGQAGTSADTWWPERVDDHPGIAAVNACLKDHAASIVGKTKVTAFDYAAGISPQAVGTCDVLIFPACLQLHSVPIDDLGAVVAAQLAAAASGLPDAGAPTAQLPSPALLICCHKSRDKRCGELGPPLAAALAQAGATVFLSSHVGGHKWAGNVIVYGQGHAASGNWFGGLSQADAGAFMQALQSLGEAQDPVTHPVLRKYWRGRTGMSKEEQLTHFNQSGCEGCVGDIEDAAQP